MKQTILNVLKDKSFSVLSSEHAKESIATEIIERLKKKGFYTEYSKEGLREQEAKKSWVCQTCGKSTFETEYDYLVHPKLHLGCALEEELKGKDIKEQYHEASESYFKDEKRMKPLDWWKKENPQLELMLDDRKKEGPDYDEQGNPSIPYLSGKYTEEDIVNNKDIKYIYESPDGGKTIHRRKFGDYNITKLKNTPSSTDIMFWKVEANSGHNDGWVQKHYQDKIDKYESTKVDTKIDFQGDII